MIPRTKLSPTQNELNTLHQWLTQLKPTHKLNILEFGAGATTWTTHQTLKKQIKSYTTIETHQPTINQITKHLPNIKNLTNWEQIPNDKYDIIIIDSSAGHPQENKNTHRHQAMQKIEPNLHPNTLIIIHDYHKTQGRKIRKYLENNHYRLQQYTTTKPGLATYKPPHQPN